MFNKESCRSCGKSLLPVSTCKSCKEPVSWMCKYCQRVEDASHKHEWIHESHGDICLTFKDLID